MNRKQLMNEVYIYGFGCDDAALFLDTHPDCQQALLYFQDCLAKYEAAVKELAQCDSPLLQKQAADDCSWKWTETPWPWEGGCC